MSMNIYRLPHSPSIIDHYSCKTIIKKNKTIINISLTINSWQLSYSTCLNDYLQCKILTIIRKIRPLLIIGNYLNHC